ncbi:MAG: ATP-binding protein [Pseudomonadota bacterium]
MVYRPVEVNRAPSRHRFQCCIPPDPGEVRHTLVDLQQALSDLVSPSWLATIELVGAEVLNNIVEHSFTDCANANAFIEIDADLRDEFLTLKVVDNGVAMPGGSVPRPPFPKVNGVPVEDLPEGGFGWALIHELSSEVHYKRSDDRNVLTLLLKL